MVVWSCCFQNSPACETLSGVRGSGGVRAGVRLSSTAFGMCVCADLELSGSRGQFIGESPARPCGLQGGLCSAPGYNRGPCYSWHERVFSARTGVQRSPGPREKPVDGGG